MKAMIYYDGPINIRNGGPSGYLANLQYGLEKINDETSKEIICFQYQPTTISNPHPKKTKKHKHNKISFYFKYFLVNFLSLKNTILFSKQLQKIENLINLQANNELIKKIEDEKISLIHCHNFLDTIKIHNLLTSNNLRNRIKIIFTSHTPEAPSFEYYSHHKNKGLSERKSKKIKEKYEVLEKKAFEYADILIFPSKEAMEPYYQTIPSFDKWIENKTIYFIETGAKQLETDLSQNEIRKKYGVPDDMITICYIGRHNTIKGYDTLCKAGKTLLHKHKDINILVGGAPSRTIIPPQNERWKELGWINPAELLKITDLFILPNLRTYFDLILLEVLSCGCPIIASKTGGNISVYKKTSAITLYDCSSEDLCNKIEDFLNLSNEEKQTQREVALKAYLENYTPEIFAKNYISLIKTILKGDDKR